MRPAVSYTPYDTSGCIAIASSYGCGAYVNVLEKNHQIQHHIKILSSLCLLRTQDTLFDAVEFQRRYHKTCIFNAFVSTCAVVFCTKHGQNSTRKRDTEVLYLF